MKHTKAVFRYSLAQNGGMLYTTLSGLAKKLYPNESRFIQVNASQLLAMAGYVSIYRVDSGRLSEQALFSLAWGVSAKIIEAACKAASTRSAIVALSSPKLSRKLLKKYAGYPVTSAISPTPKT